MGFLYLIHATGTNHYKIGFTELDPQIRLTGLQTGSPFDLTLVAHRDGTKQTECALHAKLAHYRGRGEWFTFNDHEDALFHFEIRKQKKPVAKPKMRVRSADPVQLLANKLLKQSFEPLGISPRLMGKKTWEALPGTIFYAIAQTAIKENLTPNIDGVRAIAMLKDEYWNRPTNPPIFL